MAPNPAFVQQVEAAFPLKATPLLVGCKAGPRSGRAVEALSAAGYTALADVEGGWNAWSAAGLPAEK